MPNKIPTSATATTTVVQDEATIKANKEKLRKKLEAATKEAQKKLSAKQALAKQRREAHIKRISQQQSKPK